MKKCCCCGKKDESVKYVLSPYALEVYRREEYEWVCSECLSHEENDI